MKVAVLCGGQGTRLREMTDVAAGLVPWLDSANIENREMFAGNIFREPAFKSIPHRVHGTLTRVTGTFFMGDYPGLTDQMMEFILARFKGFFDSLDQK